MRLVINCTLEATEELTVEELKKFNDTVIDLSFLKHFENTIKSDTDFDNVVVHSLKVLDDNGTEVLLIAGK